MMAMASAPASGSANPLSGYDAGGAPSDTQIALNISSACGPPRQTAVGYRRAARHASAQLAGRSSSRSGRRTETCAAASIGSAHCCPPR